jgi:hypothetical protein
MNFFQSFFQTNNIVDTFSEKIKITNLFGKFNVETNCGDQFDSSDQFDSIDESYYLSESYDNYVANINNISIINLTNSIYPQKYNDEIYEKMLTTIKIFDITTHKYLMYKNMFKFNCYNNSNLTHLDSSKFIHNKYYVVYNLNPNKEILNLLVD